MNTTNGAAKTPSEGLASRDWYGEAERRIEGLTIPGAWGDNPDVPTMGTRLGRTPGIALLRQAQRSPARTRVARTLTTPEAHPALRQPLKPATRLERPVLTIQSPTAASLARLAQPFGPADGGEAGDVDAPVVQTTSTPAPRVPFVRRIFRLLDPRPEPGIDASARPPRPRSMAARAVEAESRYASPVVSEPPPVAEARTSAPPPASTTQPGRLVARHPAHEDEASLQASPSALMRQPSVEPTPASATPATQHAEHPTAEEPAARATSPLATFARRVFRREAPAPSDAAEPASEPTPPAKTPHVVVGEDVMEGPASDERPSAPTLRDDADKTPPSRDVPPVRLELRHEAGPAEAVSVQRLVSADPVPRPLDQGEGAEARPVAPRIEVAAGGPGTQPAVARDDPAPALGPGPAPAPPAVGSEQPASPGPSLVRRVLRRISGHPEPGTTATTTTTARAQQPARTSATSEPERAVSSPPMLESRLLLRHEFHLDEVVAEPAAPPDIAPGESTVQEERARAEGPIPLQLTARMDAGAAPDSEQLRAHMTAALVAGAKVVAAARPSESLGPAEPIRDVAPQSRRTAAAPPPELVLRERPFDPPAAAPPAQARIEAPASASPAVDLAARVTEPTSPAAPTLLHRSPRAEAPAPSEVRRVFRRPAPESMPAPADARPQTVHADVLARQLGLAPGAASPRSAPPLTPSPRVEAAVRRAEQPSITRHTTAPAADEEVFRQARSEGPVAVLRAEMAEPPESTPASDTGAEAPAEPDAQALDRLAQAIYTRLRRRFVVERERAGRGERWT